MVSPFRRHQQHIRGLLSGTIAVVGGPPPEPAGDTPQGQEYAALRVLLHDNLRVLADIESIEARNPRKAEFAFAFADWIEGVLAAGERGEAAQDEILITNMIWALDYRNFDYALRLGTHAIRHNFVMPQRFERSVACFLAEEIAIVSLAQQELVNHEQLLGLAALVQGKDMPDQVTARLHKAISRSYARKADAFDPAADSAPAGGKGAWLAEALSHARRAFELHRGAGVIKDIERLERQLKALATPGDIDKETTD